MALSAADLNVASVAVIPLPDKKTSVSKDKVLMQGMQQYIDEYKCFCKTR